LSKYLTSEGEPNYHKILLPAYLCVFVDFFGNGVSMPILPYYALELGASSAEVGILLGIYPLMQFVSNIIMGKMSDKYGRKPVILASLVTSSISYVFCGLVTTKESLILTRACAGICGGTMPVAQAMVLDTVPPGPLRAKYIGICGAMLGLAFTFGPGMGAALSAVVGYQATFYATAGLCALITAFSFFNVVETHKRQPRQQQQAKEIKKGPGWGVPVWGACFAMFCAAYTFFIIVGIGGLLYLKIFGWGTSELGTVMVAVGATQVFTEAVIAKKVISRIGPLNTLCVAFVALGILSQTTCMVHSEVPFVIMSIGQCAAWGVMKVCFIIVVGTHAPAESRGAAIGAVMGCMSLVSWILSAAIECIVTTLAYFSAARWFEPAITEARVVSAITYQLLSYVCDY
jgi:MFS family permease